MRFFAYFSALTTLALTMPCSKGSSISYTEGTLFACLGTQNLAADCSVGSQNVTTFGGPAQLTTTYGTLAANQATLSATAYGNGSFGSLRAEAISSFDVTGAPTPAFVFAEGLFVDQLTISFSPLNGQQGLLFVNYALDGTISSSGAGHAFTDVTINGNGHSTTQTYTSSVSGFFSASSPITFIYGQPFSFGMSLETASGSATPAGGTFINPGTASGLGSGSSMFQNTLILTGLITTDINGNAAIGSTFTSDSGTPYTTAGVAPEPSSLLLMSAGMLGIAYAGRRRFV